MNVYRSHRSTDPNIAYLFSELDNPGCRGTCIDVFIYICTCTTCIFPLAQVLHVVVDNGKFDSVIQVGTPQPVNEQINNVCPTSVLFRILPIHLENAIQSNDG